jgi:tRNA(Ile)-lysidine synthetase-like protein
VRADRRGTARLAAFTSRCAERLATGRSPAGAALLAGGGQVRAERVWGVPSAEWVMVLYRDASHTSDGDVGAVTPLVDGAGWATVGRWSFRLVAATGDDDHGLPGASPWHTWLPAAQRYAVRVWRPGDRWTRAPGWAARRVKRFLSDHHVPAAERVGWPVVVAYPLPGADAPGDTIVWIPGVRRADAAPARPREPGLLLRCERTREPRPSVRP